MARPPRFLCLPGLADLPQELRRIGADPLAASRISSSNFHCCVRFSDLPRALAPSLLREIKYLGGEGVCPGGDTPHLDLIAVLSATALSLLPSRLANSSPELMEQGEELANLVMRINNPPRCLQGKDCCIDLSRPRIMGVLNVTPDSFSDGGFFVRIDQGLRHGNRMVDEGADIIDVGGESTRPDATPVSVQEEIDRVVPVIEALRAEFSTPLSIDTNKSSVARAAMASGASFINDISGLDFDPLMAEVAAASGAGLFLMHTRGRPHEMQRNTHYEDLLGEVYDYLRDAMQRAETAGVAVSRLAVDPGIGFGKSAEGNLHLLKRLTELQGLGRPILLGTSRKSFLGRIVSQPDPAQRLYATLATVALGVSHGANIFRVHDVRAAKEAALTAWAVCRGRLPQGTV
jgi:dihydropteroate synthase